MCSGFQVSPEAKGTRSGPERSACDSEPQSASGGDGTGTLLKFLPSPAAGLGQVRWYTGGER